MYYVFPAVIILLALLSHQAQCLSVWFDSSCSQRVQSTVWSEVKDMAAKAYDKGTDPNDIDMQRYLGYIYQNVDFITKGVLTNTELFISSYGTTSSQSTADVLFYCDKDQRWRMATDTEVPGNDARAANEKAWYDPGNQIIYDVRVSSTSQTRAVPGCRAGDKTLGETYCNWKRATRPGQKCAITLCDLAVSQKYLAISDLNVKWLANRSRKTSFFRPDVGDYQLLSHTMHHEMAHTQFSPWHFIDSLGSKSYGWDATRGMTLDQSKRNADSLAYLGIGAEILSLGYSIGKDGDIYEQGKVPTNQVKRTAFPVKCRHRKVRSVDPECKAPSL